MSKLFKILFFASLTLVLFQFGEAQTSLSGPTCVVPGVIYQYRISGNWDSTSTMQVCLAGGVIADSTNSNTCTPPGGAPLGAVLVIWSGNGNGSLTLTSTAGNASLNVSLTQPLSAGGLDSTGFQAIGFDTIPETINCASDSGGSCSPVYADQWQQSSDQVTWTDISGANSPNLNFTAPLSQTTYFRRKVIESGSGSMAFSNPAVVLVLPQSMLTDSSDSSIGWIRDWHPGINCQRNYLARQSVDYFHFTRAVYVRKRFDADKRFPLKQNYSEL